MNIRYFLLNCVACFNRVQRGKFCYFSKKLIASKKSFLENCKKDPGKTNTAVTTADACAEFWYFIQIRCASFPDGEIKKMA